MNINLVTLLLAEVSILMIIGLHFAFLSDNGTPRMRKNIDATVKVGRKFGNGFLPLALCSGVATFTAVPLLNQLTGTMKHVNFVLEIVVSAFGLLSILSVVYPLLLRRQQGHADRLAISTVILLAVGSFSGTAFKAIVATGDFKTPWMISSGLTFLTCFYAVVGLFVWSLWLLVRQAFGRPKQGPAADGDTPAVGID